MAGTMENIKEYLRLYHGVMRAPLAYVIRKTILVYTCCDYPQNVTSNNDMIASHLMTKTD